jgi:signal peptidase I
MQTIGRYWAGALLAGTAALCLTGSAGAHSVKAKPTEAVQASFDIIETTIATKGDTAVFTTRVRGEAGKEKPDATGKFEGSEVYAYVWPTSLDSGDIGFEKAQGIVALAVTFHPDFDDAANGKKNRHVWHPHWVVLAKDEACGAGLKVVDIPKDTKPKVPATWPGVPLLIDSPEYPTTFKGDAVDVTIPLSLIGGIAGASYDGVTAGLKVNGNLHAPLLCVSDVFKVVSGNLSLPGKVMPSN